MERENNPSNKGSPPSNPPTSSPERSPSPAAAAEEEILKTPEDVLADLSGTPSPGGVGQSGGVAIGVGGGSMVVGEGGVGAGKKRKGSEVKNPPGGTPTCPVCNKTFSSWKGAFGHMRKHPDRDYRGFFKPPTFSSSSSSNTTLAAAAASSHGEGGSSAQGKTDRSAAAALVRGLLLDLNLPTEEAQRSDAAGEGNEAPPAEEGKKVGFDLNEPPPPADDEEE